MMAPTQVIISAFIIALAVCVNLDQSFLTQLHIDRGYLVVTLLMVTLAGLLGHHALFVVVLVVGLAVAANLPPGLLAENNISPEMVFATLLAMVVAPTGLVLLGWQPAII